MTTSHTPGPWTYEGSTVATYSDGCTASDMARVLIPPNRPHPANVLLIGVGPEQDANARLIAAAPELLQALRMAEGILDTIGYAYCNGKDSCNCNRCIALRLSRDAIAKATR